jgi:hypothetical protein
VFNFGALASLFGAGAASNPNEINGGSRSTQYTETDEGSIALSKSFSTGTTIQGGL